MIRLRKVASVAAATALAFGTVGVPAVSAFTGNSPQNASYNFPALYKVPVTGGQTNGGGKRFTGTFGIERFVSRNGKAYAVGTLNGTLGNQHVTRYHVMMPASLTGATTPGSASRAHAAQSTQSCQVLHLVLAPIHLNLLGLNVTLGGGPNMDQSIVLDITAVAGQGNLLGNLLCGVSNLLNQGGTLSALQGDVQQLVGVLNSILGGLSGL